MPLTPRQWEMERRATVRRMQQVIIVLKRPGCPIPEPRRAALEAEARTLRDNARNATYPTP